MQRDYSEAHLEVGKKLVSNWEGLLPVTSDLYLEGGLRERISSWLITLSA